MGSPCLICHSDAVTLLLACGELPLSNRYHVEKTEEEELFSIAMYQCQDCATIQLRSNIPPLKLTPPFPWVTYREPEDHLDAVADLLGSLSDRKEGLVCGLSYKDDPLIDRLKLKGFKNCVRLDIQRDFEISTPNAGVETIQNCLTLERARALRENYGPVHVLIMRHILEHAYDPFGLMHAARHMMDEHGYIVIELPDCQPALDELDYTTIWEEHQLYFTPHTFRTALSLFGFQVMVEKLFPYPTENSLVAIAQAAASRGKRRESGWRAAAEGAERLKEERERGENFGLSFHKRKGDVHEIFGKLHRRNEKVALFGAGHLSCMFINLFGVRDFIEFVIDDNPNKQGLYLPGSKLQIVGSEALYKNSISVCLLGVNPQVEDKVLRKHKDFERKGGRLSSIFPTSTRSMWKGSLFSEGAADQ